MTSINEHTIKDSKDMLEAYEKFGKYGDSVLNIARAKLRNGVVYITVIDDKFCVGVAS